MNPKTTRILTAALVVALAGYSFVLYQSSASAQKKLIRKEQELSQKQADLSRTEAQIAELNNSLTGFQDSYQKKINALEMSLREREGAVKVLQDELESLKKENEAVARDNLEKTGAISDLTERLSALRQEKDRLLKEVEELRRYVDANKKELQPDAARSAPDSAGNGKPGSGEPFGISDKDLGANIDLVNLGEIVVSQASGRAARVQEVNPVHDFIIIDAGVKDGIREGSVVNIVRRNSLIGKAVVRQVRPGASAALILPEWKKVPVEKGDLITQF